VICENGDIEVVALSRMRLAVLLYCVELLQEVNLRFVSLSSIDMSAGIFVAESVWLVDYMKSF